MEIIERKYANIVKYQDILAHDSEQNNCSVQLPTECEEFSQFYEKNVFLRTNFEKIGTSLKEIKDSYLKTKNRIQIKK